MTRDAKEKTVLHYWTGTGHKDKFPTTGFLAEWLQDYLNCDGGIEEEICKIALKCAIENY